MGGFLGLDLEMRQRHCNAKQRGECLNVPGIRIDVEFLCSVS